MIKKTKRKYFQNINKDTTATSKTFCYVVKSLITNKGAIVNKNIIQKQPFTDVKNILQHTRIPVTNAKFLRTYFLQNTFFMKKMLLVKRVIILCEIAIDGHDFSMS